ncbi:MAG: phosphoribosylaminoimidazolesuccinocarboxamide synthase [Clostridiales bacterium]|jgi:phosphoribosylaminoimidazole-succinocarboxamide synthase|nr:phosphoribosylaminoimidazolesuccinocarboxamide synthase [Clostridiales bacterium]
MKKIISGKVRDVYEIDDDHLVIVTTDRISAYDVILSKPVKDKGKVLNALSLFWFDYTKDIVRNHVISDKLSDMPEFFRKPEFEARSVLVEKLKILPFEFIIRGYIFGNMWKAYQDGKEFCGSKIEGNYQQAEKLEAPILTPSTKMSEGHDVYVSFDYTANALGKEMAEKINALCLKLYDACYKRAYESGIIIADTKFEFGLDKENNLVLADEIFTPDSSRFWSLTDYEIGISPKSYDKQFIRDWLIGNKINGEIQYDNVPDDIINKTSEIYQECLKKIAGGYQ